MMKTIWILCLTYAFFLQQNHAHTAIENKLACPTSSCNCGDNTISHVNNNVLESVQQGSHEGVGSPLAKCDTCSTNRLVSNVRECQNCLSGTYTGCSNACVNNVNTPTCQSSLNLCNNTCHENDTLRFIACMNCAGTFCRTSVDCQDACSPSLGICIQQIFPGRNFTTIQAGCCSCVDTACYTDCLTDADCPDPTCFKCNANSHTCVRGLGCGALCKSDSDCMHNPECTVCADNEINFICAKL